MDNEKKFEEILSKINEIKDMLSNVEKHKSNVSDDVYNKVKIDYESRLKDLSDTLGEKSSELKSNLKEIVARKTEFKKKMEVVTSELEELNLRHMVGEIDDGTFNSKKSIGEEEKTIVKEELLNIISSEKDLQALLAQSGEKLDIKSDEDVIHPAPLFDNIEHDDEIKSDNEIKKKAVSILDESEKTDNFDETFNDVFQAEKKQETDEKVTEETEYEEKKIENDERTTIKCSKCGNDNQPDAWYCENCGAPLFP